MLRKLVQHTKHSFDIEYSKQALKFLKTHTELKQRFDKEILDLPRSKRVEKMSGYENRYRSRVGDYRIIFDLYEDVLLIVIVSIDSRGQVYRHLD